MSEKKKEPILERISKMRMRYFILVGALLGFAIASPTLVPLVPVSFSDLPDHPFAEWTDSRIPFRDCPEQQLFYTGYMSGCVPKQFEGLARDSEIFVDKFPTTFYENGTNTFKSGKQIHIEYKEFEKAELLLECDYNHNQLLGWIEDGSVTSEDLQTFIAKCGDSYRLVGSESPMSANPSRGEKLECEYDYNNLKIGISAGVVTTKDIEYFLGKCDSYTLGANQTIWKDYE